MDTFTSSRIYSCCLKNKHIECEIPGAACDTCGWDPKVAAARTEAVRAGEMRPSDDNPRLLTLYV